MKDGTPVPEDQPEQSTISDQAKVYNRNLGPPNKCLTGTQMTLSQ